MVDSGQARLTKGAGAAADKRATLVQRFFAIAHAEASVPTCSYLHSIPALCSQSTREAIAAAVAVTNLTRRERVQGRHARPVPGPHGPCHPSAGLPWPLHICTHKHLSRLFTTLPLPTPASLVAASTAMHSAQPPLPFASGSPLDAAPSSTPSAASRARTSSDVVKHASCAPDASEEHFDRLYSLRLSTYAPQRDVLFSLLHRLFFNITARCGICIAFHCLFTALSSCPLDGP